MRISQIEEKTSSSTKAGFLAPLGKRYRSRPDKTFTPLVYHRIRFIMRGRTGIQETGDVPRVICLISGDVVLNQSPGPNLDGRVCQGNPGTARGRTGIQETGGVPRVMCLIRGDIVLNQPPRSNVDGRASQRNPGTILGRTGIQENGNVDSVICVSRGNPRTFFEQCEVSTVR